MTGRSGQRVYLDWNASAPLRPEARAAMLEAMDVVGNPSSVHVEGRLAKAIIEKARRQVATLVDCEPEEVLFTSGATEGAASLCSAGRFDKVFCVAVDHDCLFAHGSEKPLPVDRNGQLPKRPLHPLGSRDPVTLDHPLFTSGVTNSETGVELDAGEIVSLAEHFGASVVLDAVQSIGKQAWSFKNSGALFALASAHKIGGPKGVGAVIAATRHQIEPLTKGGGQEMGQRSGTENVAGIAGFGAAAEAASRDLETGVWEQVAERRNRLEDHLATTAADMIIFGQDVPRLPNTSCFAIPGWAGETQVMQMDLSGYAVSAGSACSSGKVKRASRVLLAMGYEEATASSAIRVSIGPTTTEADMMAFADTWIDHYKRFRQKAA